MRHQTITGRIVYTSRKPERLGEERGRENFTMTRHSDGAVTIRATCEIEEPDPTVLRDVIYSLGPDGRPSDCFVRLTVGDRFMGSGWFRMESDAIECESWSPMTGRISQTMPTNGWYHGFGTHPIIGDAYMTRCIDAAQGPQKQALRVFLPSVDHRGATPPLLAEGNLFLEYVGDETVAVAAGTFACRHFRFTDEEGGMVSKDGAHPPYDVWVTADEHAVFVQGGVGGYMQTWYELVDLRC
jgi:hypothetical protein